MAELRAYEPTWRDRISNALMGDRRAGPARNALIGGLMGSTGLGSTQLGLVDFAPPGWLLSGQEGQQAARQNNLLGGVIGAMGALPGAKVAGRGLARGRIALDYFGQPVTILQNPTRSGLQGFLNRTQYKAARRVTDPATGDVYVWDAADPALHAHVAEKLGIDPAKMVADMIGID